MSKLEWVIASRYLKSKQREGFISIVSLFSLIGIALGVATLIIVMSVMSGYETQLIDKILGMNSHIMVYPTQLDKEQYKNLYSNIQNTQHVESVSEVISGQGMLIGNWSKKSKGVLIKGMTSGDVDKYKLLAQGLENFDIQVFDRGDGIIIGKGVADELNLVVGDTAKLIVPKTDNLIFGMIPRTKTLKIVGIFDVGMYEYNSNMALISYNIASLLFDEDHQNTMLEIFLDHTKNLDQVRSEFSHFIDEKVLITDWSDTNKSLSAALRVERNVMFLILSLMIIIAAFNIVSSLIMLVQDKKRSIAILRTIGMKRSSVIKTFVICGSVIGVIGTVLGSIIGVIFTLYIDSIKCFLENITDSVVFDPIVYYLTSLPAEISYYDVTFIIITSLLISLLSTIYPAWKASKIMPATALRYE